MGIIFSGTVLFFLTKEKAIYRNTKQAETDIGIPVRLIIPAISLDAAIESLGTTAQGVMDVPQNPMNTGWFNKGPKPGERGNAVIDGHSGWENGTVFDNLYKLKKGDAIYTIDENNKVVTFVVRSIRTYKEYEDANPVFNEHDGKPHLNLITCAGVWNANTNTSPDRLVVFADLQ